MDSVRDTGLAERALRTTRRRSRRASVRRLKKLLSSAVSCSRWSCSSWMRSKQLPASSPPTPITRPRRKAVTTPRRTVGVVTKPGGTSTRGPVSSFSSSFSSSLSVLSSSVSVVLKSSVSDDVPLCSSSVGNVAAIHFLTRWRTLSPPEKGTREMEIASDRVGLYGGGGELGRLVARYVTPAESVIEGMSTGGANLEAVGLAAGNM